MWLRCLSLHAYVRSRPLLVVLWKATSELWHRPLASLWVVDAVSTALHWVVDAASTALGRCVGVNACIALCALSLVQVGLNVLLNRAKNFSPTKRMIVQRFIPFPAVGRSYNIIPVLTLRIPVVLQDWHCYNCTLWCYGSTYRMTVQFVLWYATHCM